MMSTPYICSISDRLEYSLNIYTVLYKMIFKKLNAAEIADLDEITLPTKNVDNEIMRYIRDKELKRRIHEEEYELQVDLINVNEDIFYVTFTREGSSYIFKNFGSVITDYNLTAGDMLEFTPIEIGEKLIIQFKVTRPQ